MNNSECPYIDKECGNHAQCVRCTEPGRSNPGRKENNMYDTMYAKVRGKTCEGEEFEEELKFHLMKPESKIHYGTGYYMGVEMSLSGRQLEDVRYAKTTDIEILADRFIRGWYGENDKEITKWFVEE